jgi:hypothetical protein
MTIRLPDFVWRSAIHRWRAGDPSKVAQLLREEASGTAQYRVRPEFATHWLVEVIEGKARRPRGRPPRLTAPTVREAMLPHLVREYFQLQLTLHQGTGARDDTPKTLALEATAAHFERFLQGQPLTAEAVSHLVYPRSRPRRRGA